MGLLDTLPVAAVAAAAAGYKEGLESSVHHSSLGTLPGHEEACGAVGALLEERSNLRWELVDKNCPGLGPARLRQDSHTDPGVAVVGDNQEEFAAAAVAAAAAEDNRMKEKRLEALEGIQAWVVSAPAVSRH